MELCGARLKALGLRVWGFLGFRLSKQLFIQATVNQETMESAGTVEGFLNLYRVYQNPPKAGKIMAQYA